MAFNGTNPWVVGEGVRKERLDRCFDNTKALKAASSRLPLGGDPNAEIADTSYVTIPGFVIIEIVCDDLGGSDLIREVHAMAKVRAGTGRIRLWNITDAGVVGAEITFTNTSIALVKITGLTLPASGTKQFRLEVRGAAAADLPTVYGAQLVLR